MGLQSNNCSFEIVYCCFTVFAAGSSAPGIPPPKPKNFYVDHGFIFYLFNKQMGTMLFVGRTTEPIEK